MMNFTRDERNLMMLYSPGTRSGLCEALLQMKEQLSEEEAELCALADSVLNKLSGMDDETFDTGVPNGSSVIERFLWLQIM